MLGQQDRWWAMTRCGDDQIEAGSWVRIKRPNKDEKKD